MANPAAPREANDATGAKMLYGIHDTGAADEAALLRIIDAAVVSDETTKSGALGVHSMPVTLGGYTIHRTISAATTNATSVKAAAGQLYGYYLFNVGASTAYVKFYNKASAPTVGTDTPVMTLPLPSGGGANANFVSGIAFATGLAFAITGAITDADTTAVAANEIVVNLLYA